jgi:hypothetical protein
MFLFSTREKERGKEHETTKHILKDAGTDGGAAVINCGWPRPLRKALKPISHLRWRLRLHPNRCRFLASNEVALMRLEVFALGGAQLYDSDFKTGNLFDWNLQDQQGQRFADGAYRCLLTVKDAAGHTSQRQGLLLVQAGEAAWQSPEQTERALSAFNPANATERAEFITPVPADKGLAAAVLAHNGREGRLMTGSGALSFRTGDFMAGKDQEQMRLTSDGKLGIGVTDPQAKLDVAGPIRTSEGIVFPDGTVQTTAYVASGRSLSEGSNLKRDAQGRTLTEQDDKALGRRKTHV